jgi:hypothetical protein
MTLQELHNKNNLHPEHRYCYLVHQYDNKTKEWKFKHYKCSICGTSIKHASTIPRHETTCRITIRQQDKRVKEPEVIITTKGMPWSKKYDI